MAVSANDLIVGPLTPALGVTTISLDFYFEQAAWLEVYKSGSETALILNTDYTVTGAGTGSGVVTLTEAADGVSAYTVYLVVPLQRSSDMQTRGGFQSEPFNIEMDRLWQALQFLSTQRLRSFRVGATDDAPAVFQPEPETVMGFDASGETVLYPVNEVVTVAPDPDNLVRFDTAAAALADTTMGYTGGASVTVAAGDYVVTTEDGHAYEVAASGASDHHVTTAGGVKLYQRAVAMASYNRGNGASYQMGTNYGTMDQTVRGSWMFDGRGSYPNKLGVNGAKPVDDAPWGARTAEAGYVAGAAEVAAILGGYDNVVNAIAAFIASQHSMIYAGADHASIWGGSLHTIWDDTDYSVIVGGTGCRIQARGRHAGIYHSENSLLETGASDAEAGFRGTIIGGLNCTVGGRNGVILGGVTCSIQSTYGTIWAGESITLTNGTHMGAGGNTITMGASSAATYSLAWGYDHTIDGARAAVFGDGHRVGAGHDYVLVSGYRCKTPFIGAQVRSARHRGGTVGNNMALDWTASQETTDTTTTRLSAAGSANYPTQPDSSIVNGTVWVTGVSDAGVCSSFKIDFTSERIGSGTPTLRANATTTLYNGLALGTVPTMNVTSGGIYRVQVVGLAATNIRWDARFTGQQIVYA